jgi:hypothetical protein
MNGLLDRFSAILHRRFMIVSFLPVLIFVGGLAVLVLVSMGRSAQTLGWWSSLPGSFQLVLVLATLAAVWLLAGFVDSQSRNLIQVFEGYPLEKIAPRVHERAVAWHEACRALLVYHEKDERYEAAAKALGKHRPEQPDRFTEDDYILYPEEGNTTLPTRLGNVIRAAEDHAQARYDIDYLIVWPRLAHMCSERFVEEYEDSRAKLEFLLVVSTLAGLFAFTGGTLLLVFQASVVAFAVVVLCGACLAWLAYSSAVHAAIEYGEKIRASVDLYRLDLLRQLRYAEPHDLDEEKSYWNEFAELFKREDRVTPYVPLLQAPDEPTRNTDGASP